MDRPTCATCPYWDGQWDEDIANERLDPEFDAFGDMVKECHRFPSGRSDLDRFSGVGRDEQASNLLVQGYGTRMEWLHTTAEDWCGEHPDFPAYLESWKANRSTPPR